ALDADAGQLRLDVFQLVVTDDSLKFLHVSALTPVDWLQSRTYQYLRAILSSGIHDRSLFSVSQLYHSMALIFGSRQAGRTVSAWKPPTTGATCAAKLMPTKVREMAVAEFVSETILFRFRKS
ncbi:MAG: hypothetical protein ACK524_00970, partial [Planctomyces sp.]